jgi:hypothetical protein
MENTPDKDPAELGGEAGSPEGTGATGAEAETGGTRGEHDAGRGRKEEAFDPGEAGASGGGQFGSSEGGRDPGEPGLTGGGEVGGESGMPVGGGSDNDIGMPGNETTGSG